MASWCSQTLETCKHCGQSDYEPGFGPRTLLICDACQTIGAHLACEESTGVTITEAIFAAGHVWYCSEVRDIQSV